MLVRLRPKFQLTVPKTLADKLGIKVDDMLRIDIDKKGTITLTPMSVVDRKRAA